MSGSLTSSTRPRPWLLLAGLSLLLVSGCGNAPAGSGADTVAVEDVGPVVRVLYAWESEGEWGHLELEVIAQGPERSRTELVLYGDGPPADETVVVVRDGNRALLFDDAAQPPYTVLEAADEHPDEFFRQTGPLDPTGDAFRELCPDAEPTGSRTIIGRTALGHTCSWKDPDPDLWQEDSIWLDEVTGMVLEHGVMRARELEEDPEVDARTFSTTPPEGADVRVVKATGKGAPTPAEKPELAPEEALRAIAADSATPVYHLGAEFDGEPMSDVVIVDRSTGREAVGDLTFGPDQDLTVFYGDSLHIGQERFEPESYRRAAGCSRLPPLRGVPTVQQSDAVWLFTADLVIRIGSLYDPEDAVPVAAALREVGGDPSRANLPSPPAGIVALVDVACGAKPGEHGPEIDQ